MKKVLFILIISLAFLSAPAWVRAASLSFGAPASVNTGENLDVVVNADTGGTLINSIELTVSYDKDLLSFSGYSDDNSVVKLWIDPPHAGESWSPQAGQVFLSGIIPGGVLGVYDAKKKGLAPLPLVHLLFVAKKTGNATFSFLDSKILKNDGKGTPLPHENLSAQVEIINNPAGATEKNPAKEIAVANGVSHPSSSPLWIILLFTISCIVGYKLLKYRA